MATAAKASQDIDFGSDSEGDSGLDTGTLLGVIGGIKKEEIGWIAVLVSLISLFFGLSQATHMFS